MSTSTQLAEALSDQTVQRIRLLNNLSGNITITRRLDLALEGFTITGNVAINHTESGTITIEQGMIQGDLLVNTPNATVINKANVTGITTIQDVADNTFDNSGQLKKLEVTDPNGARIINRQANLIETFIIDSPAPIELSGVFETVELLQNSFITFAENTRLEELKANDTISVEVIKSNSVEINSTPPQMKESELRLNDTTVIKRLRALIEQMKPYVEKDLTDETIINQFIELSREASELSSVLYEKDPRGTLTQQLLGESARISNKFFELIPTPEDLAKIFNEFKIEIVNGTEEEAHFVFPKVPEGMWFYLSSDPQVNNKYMIPARPLNEGEVRHVFASYTFSKGDKHLSQRGFFRIPAGTDEITFEVMDPKQYPSLSDYTTSTAFQLGKNNPFAINVAEGITVEELLNSSLLAERKKQVMFTVFKRIQGPVMLTSDYQMEFNKEFNSSINQIVHNPQLDDTNPNFVSLGEGGFAFNEMNKMLEVKGDLLSDEFRQAFVQEYVRKHPQENPDRLNVNFIQILKPNMKLETGHQLLSESVNGNEGLFYIELLPSN